MRKLIGIIVCLGLTAALSAVTYQPCKASDFRSTSSYVVNGNQTLAPQAQMGLASARTAPTGSLSAISASNFESLNSEAGLMGSSEPSGPRRGIGRGDGNGGVGVITQESPVGDTPGSSWLSWRLVTSLSAPPGAGRQTPNSLSTKH